MLDGGDGTDILVANGGNDTLIGGLGADKIYFGPGDSVVRDTLADLNGDTVRDFGFGIGRRPGLAHRPRQRCDHTDHGHGQRRRLDLRAQRQLRGGDGAFIIRRAAAVTAPTRTEPRELPAQPGGRRGVNPATVNGVASQTFLSGDGTVRFTLEMRSAVSSFANTLGFYKVAADGTISSVHILFANTLNTAPGTTVDLGTPGNGERIGFFLVQDGFHNLRRTRPKTFLRTAGNRSRRQPQPGARALLMSASHGPITGVEIFHSFATINPGRRHPGAVGRLEPAGGSCRSASRTC